jgi:hypothetical protein
LAAWNAYVTLVGGDIFPAYRHLVPSAILLALLGGHLVEWLRAHATYVSNLGPKVLGALGVLLAVQLAEPSAAKAREERWEWDGLALGRLYRAAFAGRGALIAVDAAGALPYAAGLPSLDMLGLNDRHIAKAPLPPTVSCSRTEDCRGQYCSSITRHCEPYVAHDHADGGYVLDRRPDLIVFGLPAGSIEPTWIGGAQMSEDPRFSRSYRSAHFAAEGDVRGVAWVNIDGRIGLAYASNRITIPAYLFAANATTPARLDRKGRLSLWLPAGTSGRFSRLRLPAGTWTATTDPEGAAVVMLARTGNERWADARVGQPFVQAFEDDCDVQVVSASGRDIWLHGVSLHR